MSKQRERTLIRTVQKLDDPAFRSFGSWSWSSVRSWLVRSRSAHKPVAGFVNRVPGSVRLGREIRVFVFFFLTPVFGCITKIFATWGWFSAFFQGLHGPNYLIADFCDVLQNFPLFAEWSVFLRVEKSFTNEFIMSGSSMRYGAIGYTDTTWKWRPFTRNTPNLSATRGACRRQKFRMKGLDKATLSLASFD